MWLANVYIIILHSEQRNKNILAGYEAYFVKTNIFKDIFNVQCFFHKSINKPHNIIRSVFYSY